MKFDCELTDTFGGEANYSWVKRAIVEVPEKASRRTIILAAKAALGLTGMRCEVREVGDQFEIRPSGLCQVAFVTFREPEWIVTDNEGRDPEGKLPILGRFHSEAEAAAWIEKQESAKVLRGGFGIDPPEE